MLYNPGLMPNYGEMTPKQADLTVSAGRAVVIGAGAGAAGAAVGGALGTAPAGGAGALPAAGIGAIVGGVTGFVAWAMDRILPPDPCPANKK